MNFARAVVGLSGRIVMMVMFVLLGLFLSALFAGFGPDGRNPPILGVVFFAFEGGYFGWLLSIGLVANSIAKSKLRIQPLLAVVTLPVAVLYFAFIPVVLFTGHPPSAPVIAIHFFSMAVNFYVLWFASRSVCAAEVNRPPKLKDYLPTILLLWFGPMFPLAVKWTQERVQARLKNAR